MSNGTGLMCSITNVNPGFRLHMEYNFGTVHWVVDEWHSTYDDVLAARTSHLKVTFAKFL
jgi:hypothetical protein